MLISSICSRKKLLLVFKLASCLAVLNYFGYLLFTRSSTPSTLNESNPIRRQMQAHDFELKKFEEFVKKRQEALQQKEEENKEEPEEEKVNVSVRKRFYAVDGNGLASVNTEIVKCSPTLEVEVLNAHRSAEADFTYFLNSAYMGAAKAPTIDKTQKQHRHYYMVYAMESEPHSGGGDTWSRADFRMWYNLGLSFPEPATYLDVRSFLPDLLARPRVDFAAKETSAPLVWILSNCHAFNGRESFIGKLMKKIGVDSYGGCLRNKNTHTSSRMTGECACLFHLG